MTPARLRAGKAMLAASGLAIGVVVGEASLRLTDYPPTPVNGWRAKDVPPGEHNEFGFRGRALGDGPHNEVVVLLGDSQVQGGALPFEDIPERSLERHLTALRPGRRVRVVTLGADGYGQDQQLLVLRDYLERHPARLVVLWETPGNDVWNNLFPTHWPKDGPPKPTYWLEGGALRGPNAPMGAPIPRFKLQALVSRIRRDSPDESWAARLPLAYRPRESYAGPVDRSWQQAWDRSYGIFRDEDLTSEKSHLSLWLTPRSPRMQYGLDLTRALLRAIAELAASRGAGLLLFATVSPDEAENVYVLRRGVEKVFVLQGRYYRASRAQQDLNVADLNAGLEFRPMPITVADWRVGPEDAHLNARATDQVMRDLATLAASRLALPVP